MKCQFLIILLLLTLVFMYISASSNSIFSKDTMIAHPEIGLFLDYIGMYTPSETIIHNSAIFPMTSATCHFLPVSIVEKIPSCNMTLNRHKRAIPALIAIPIIISLVVGALSTGMSASNTVQAMNLQREVAVVENTLTQFSQTMQTHGAHLARIHSNQIRIVEELQMTQKALDAMTPILQSHSASLTRLAIGFERLHLQLQHSFLYLAITQISKNDLTLNFLSSDDLRKVVYDVMYQAHLRLDSRLELIPLVQIVTKLLIRQQIDFLPSSQYQTSDRDEIGRLVITSFFAIPQRKHSPFHIYKLLAVPFFRNNETVRLAGIPKYLAINPTNNDTIEWYDPHECGCDFQLIVSCRDTPPIRKLSENTCFGQIMGYYPVSECYTVLASIASFFVHKLRDNIYITSTREPIHCLKMPKIDYSTNVHLSWNSNEHVVFPSVALVNVTSGYTITCPGFSMTGSPIISNVSSFKIIYDKRLFTDNISVLSINAYLSKNITWVNRKPFVLNTNDTMYNLQTWELPNTQTFQYINTWIFGMLAFSWIVFGIVVGLLYYKFRKSKLIR